jgi:hypothetical protein
MSQVKVSPQLETLTLGLGGSGMSPPGQQHFPVVQFQIRIRAYDRVFPEVAVSLIVSLLLVDFRIKFITNFNKRLLRI